jgi:hypothetical protein
MILTAATPPPAHDLQTFIRSVEHKTGKPVHVITLPAGNTLSHGGFSSTAIYALMQAGASDGEVVHEVLHSVLGMEGYVATKSGLDNPHTGMLSGNFQDFIIHPLLDRRAKALGFSQKEVAEAHAKSFRSYLYSVTDPIDETKSDRIGLAANAMGFAEVMQRNFGPMIEINYMSQKRLPIAFALATSVMKKFPPQPHLTSAKSYEVAKALLAFLDAETRSHAGSAPSAALRIVNPRTEPLVDADQEAVFRQYMQSTQQVKH